MKYLTAYCSSTKKSKFIFLNESPVERGKEPPEMKRQQALAAIEYARQQSIFLEDTEADQLKAVIEMADMTIPFNRHSQRIPDRVMVDFFASQPLMIELNEIIVAVRDKQNKNKTVPFVEIFKIALAYRNGLIDKFE